MEDKIKVNLGEDHAFECETNIIGREGEGNTSQLEIVIPEKLCGCSIYIDFEKPNGEKHRTPKLEVIDGVAYYEVDPYLLTVDGEIKAQIVLQTENGGIWKSTVKKYINQHSINAFEEVPEQADFMANAERVMAEAEQQLADGLAQYNQRFTEIFTQFDQELNELAVMVANDPNFISKVGELNAETLAQHTEDIAKNAEDIAKNGEDIALFMQKLAEIAPYSLVQPDENGDFPLEIGKTYRVFFEEGSTPNLKVTYCRGSSHTLYTATTAINYSSYKSVNYFTITPVKVVTKETPYSITINYSVNGEEEMAWKATENTFHISEPITVSITGATKCLLQNDEPYLR